MVYWSITTAWGTSTCGTQVTGLRMTAKCGSDAVHENQHVPWEVEAVQSSSERSARVLGSLPFAPGGAEGKGAAAEPESSE